MSNLILWVEFGFEREEAREVFSVISFFVATQARVWVVSVVRFGVDSFSEEGDFLDEVVTLGGSLPIALDFSHEGVFAVWVG